MREPEVEAAVRGCLASKGYQVLERAQLAGVDVLATKDDKTLARRTEEARMGKARRTTHRSASGTKLYAVRDAKGRFKDIQTYKRAHGSDIRQKAKREQ